MDIDEEEESAKRFLRSMPVWDLLEKVKDELLVISHDLDLYRLRQGARQDLIEMLPTIEGQPPLKPVEPFDEEVQTTSKISSNNNGKNRSSHDDTNNNTENEISEEQKRSDKSLSLLSDEIRLNQKVYGANDTSQPWVLSRVSYIHHYDEVRPGHPKVKITLRLLDNPNETMEVNEYGIALIQNHGRFLQVSKRVIAGRNRKSLFSGIIAAEPSPQNCNRYLVLMDDGSAQYSSSSQICPILAQTYYPWQDSRFFKNLNPLNCCYLRNYFCLYPRKELFQFKTGIKLEVAKNGITVSANAISIDCDVVSVRYKDDTEETIYRGSPRFQRQNNSSIRSDYVQATDFFHPSLLKLIQLYYESGQKALEKSHISKNTARKSTITRNIKKEKKVRKVFLRSETVDEVLDCVEFIDLDNNDEHKCNPACLEIPGVRTEYQVKDIVDEFRDVSDLKVPLLLGWKRNLKQISCKTKVGKSRLRVNIIYESPCKKYFTSPLAVRRYLMNTYSKLDIDHFSFDKDLVLNRNITDYLEARYYLENLAMDLNTGQPLENKVIRVINQYSDEGLDRDFIYRPDRIPHPHLSSQGFTFNEEFKSSCNCTEDCYQRIACDCHRLNEISFGVNAYNRGTIEPRCNYTNKRLLNQVPTAIFECNSMCSCSSKCSNRVVQNGIRFRLVVQKTLRKGWGVLTLDDIPEGAFICTYSAELLDDADSYGKSDMYYADLDFISANQQAKEIFSDDDEGVDIIYDNIDYKANLVSRSIETDYNIDEEAHSTGGESVDSSQVESLESKDENGQKRYPRRTRQNEKKIEKTSEPAPRKPQVKVRDGKFKDIHGLLGSHDYTLDSGRTGNVGRFFNHSCEPNAFVQNVFIETHDLRFPVVAFFAIRTIKALEEITWNYNYKIGSIPNRQIICHCGAVECRGRIL